MSQCKDFRKLGVCLGEEQVIQFENHVSSVKDAHFKGTLTGWTPFIQVIVNE